MPLRHPRLVAYQGIIRSLSRSRNVWLDFLQRLPLTLGESDADRVAPYSFSDSVQSVFDGAVLGLVIAAGVALLQFGGHAVHHFPWTNEIGVLGWGLVAGIILSVVGAVGPDWKAARMQPVEALRVEE